MTTYLFYYCYPDNQTHLDDYCLAITAINFPAASSMFELWVMEQKEHIKLKDVKILESI